jgi:hypothetical protein
MHRLVAFVILTACAPAVRVSFTPVDPRFAARSGPTPRVYFDANELPRGRLRSAGVIEGRGASRPAIIDALQRRGAALGCQFLIEHHVFRALRSQLSFGAQVSLAHGALDVPGAKTRRVVIEVECAFEDTGRATIDASRMTL